MQTILGTIQVMFGCSTLLVIALVVALALPKSQLRAFVLPIVGWLFAICCGLMCLSPIDLIPEVVLGPVGLVDDVGYIVAGIAAARTAMSAADDV